MRSLPHPAVDAVTAYDGIAASKQEPTRGLLYAARARVLGAYGEYRSGLREIATFQPLALDADTAAALNGAYEVRTNAMEALRESLLHDEAVAQCPYCNVSEAPTLDHHLPQRKYPEFSLFPLNLVPCCGWCNTKKRALILDRGTRTKCFLHPYLDEATAEGCLAVAVDLGPRIMKVNFHMEVRSGAGTAAFDRIALHFETLGVADRYARVALRYLRGRGASFARMYGDGRTPSRLANALRDDSAHLASLYGPNHWEAVLCGALGNHPGFCEGGFLVLMAGRKGIEAE